MSWTDERVAVLSKLWADGLSASQIAAELGGGVTRNAVIGKVHRLGLSGRAKSPSTGARAKRTPKTSKPRVAKSPTARTSRPSSLVPKMGMAASAGPAINLVAPKSRCLSLEALTEITCKWPEGDPATPDFSFCGAHTDAEGPYCKYHAALAYQPLADRRRHRRPSANGRAS